ncbi:MAG TPA: phosphatidylserine decarboxylase [Aeromonadales bacterium]|nr:phosphatidylserine decarboxylase [Aeromonadales bacterium]
MHIIELKSNRLFYHDNWSVCLNIERLKTLPQYLLPQHSITRLIGHYADEAMGPKTTKAIKWFVDRYKVNMNEAANPDIASYKTFNEFFTRPLKEGIRPICGEGFLASPVDGAVSQAGRIRQHFLIQAKNHDYTNVDLLAGDKTLASKFDDGNFATIYLAPKDYHRIHMPIDGKLVGMKHVPGKLFSVNPITARNVPNLFARNERVICLFETEVGLMAQILVGATIVGSMETVWHGTVKGDKGHKVSTFRYQGNDAITLKKGDEMGRFKLGSTVILLFEKNAISLNAKMQPDTDLKYGQMIATIHNR